MIKVLAYALYYLFILISITYLYISTSVAKKSNKILGKKYDQSIDVYSILFIFVN